MNLIFRSERYFINKSQIAAFAAILVIICTLSGWSSRPENEKLPVWVLILPKFEVGEMAGDFPGEAQLFYEEYISGSVSEVLEIDNIKGEIVIILEGFKEEGEASVDVNSKIDELISLGYKPNEAIKDVSKMFNLDRKEVYKNYLTYKNKGEQDE